MLSVKVQHKMPSVLYVGTLSFLLKERVQFGKKICLRGLFIRMDIKYLIPVGALLFTGLFSLSL